MFHLLWNIKGGLLRAGRSLWAAPRLFWIHGKFWSWLKLKGAVTRPTVSFAWQPQCFYAWQPQHYCVGFRLGTELPPFSFSSPPLTLVAPRCSPSLAYRWQPWPSFDKARHTGATCGRRRSPVAQPSSGRLGSLRIPPLRLPCTQGC